MGDFGQTDFVGAVQQAVRILHADHAGPAMDAGQGLVLHDAPRGLIADPDIPDLALLHRLGEAGIGFLDRRRSLRRVGFIAELAEEIGVSGRPVYLVQVDAVRLQTLKAGLECRLDVVRSQLWSVAQILHHARTGHLGSQDDIVAPAAFLEPRADVLLGAALCFLAARHRVHLRGIDEIDAVGQCAVELVVGFRLGVLLAEGHGPQTDPADVQFRLAKWCVLHMRFR